MGKIFDWIQAANYIREHHLTNAWAGLAEDWGYTAGIILEDGKIVDNSYVFLYSDWATPALKYFKIVDNVSAWITVPCFIDDVDLHHNPPHDWNEYTIWPEEALKIMKGYNANETL